MFFHSHEKSEAGQFDRVGILISAICLVHCTVLPLGLAALQLWGVNFIPHEAHAHNFHLALAIILLGVGSLAFGQGYIYHRRSLPLILGIFGTALLFIGSLNPGHLLTHGQEHIATILGTLALLTAHLKNRVSCASCPPKII